MLKIAEGEVYQTLNSYLILTVNKKTDSFVLNCNFNEKYQIILVQK